MPNDANDLKPSNTLREQLKEIYGETERRVAAASRNHTAGGIDESDFHEVWKKQQPKHLPLSLDLVKAGKPLLVYGREKEGEPGPRTLLLMAGFSEEQLALCIGLHVAVGEVSHIVAFTGNGMWNGEDGVQKQLDNAINNLGLKDDVPRPICVELDEGDTSNPAAVFQKIVSWSRGDDGRKFKACAIDVTGGQKPMDSGATYAAMYLGWPAYYLNFKEYDRSRRRPYPWTLRYQRLDLPSVVFSHHARMAVLTNFEGRRFSLALDRIQELKKGIADHPLYFNSCDSNGRTEADRIQTSESMIRRCSHWLSGIVKENPASSMRDRLSALMIGAGTKQVEPLASYIRAEYHRLMTFHTAMSKGDDGTSNENIRDVLVGSVGLAEVIIDSFFFHAGLAPAMTVERITSDKIPGRSVNLKGAAIPMAVQNLPVPGHRMPHSMTVEKVAVLRGKSEGPFKIRVLADDELFESQSSSTIVWETFQRRFTENKSTTRSDPQLIVHTSLRLVNNGQLIDTPEDVWLADWGDVGNGEGDWFGTRNLIAHLRAPVGEPELTLAERAMNEYLPRLIGLWDLAFSNGTPSFPISSKEAKAAGDKFLAESPAPWDQPGQTASELCQLLSLPEHVRQRQEGV